MATSGVGVYLKLQSQTFNKLPIARDQAEELGKRVVEEFEKDVTKDSALQRKTKKIVVE